MNEETAPATQAEQTVNQYREQRIKHMEARAAMGSRPFGQAFTRTGRVSEILAAFEEGREVTAAGRLTAIRSMGKSVFADIHDGSARIQLYVGKKTLSEDAFAAFGLLDMGDLIGV